MYSVLIAFDTDDVWNEQGFTAKELDFPAAVALGEESDGSARVFFGERGPSIFRCWAIRASQVASTRNSQEEALSHGWSLMDRRTRCLPPRYMEHSAAAGSTRGRLVIQRRKIFSILPSLSLASFSKRRAAME